MHPTLYHNYVVKPAIELYRDLTLHDTQPLSYEPAILAQQIIAVSYQESKIIARRQYGSGPARGYLQYEPSGVILDIMFRGWGRKFATHFDLLKPSDPRLAASELYKAVEYNDQLGVLMFIDKYQLHRIPLKPESTEEQRWNFYLETWGPGKPRPAKWHKSCEIARRAVEGTVNVE